jgi:hypothetical protein
MSTTKELLQALRKTGYKQTYIINHQVVVKKTTSVKVAVKLKADKTVDVFGKIPGLNAVHIISGFLSYFFIFIPLSDYVFMPPFSPFILAALLGQGISILFYQGQVNKLKDEVRSNLESQKSSPD